MRETTKSKSKPFEVSVNTAPVSSAVIPKEALFILYSNNSKTSAKELTSPSPPAIAGVLFSPV